jgi:hypothetical protein
MITLNDVIQVVPEGNTICVKVESENAATEYWYPPKEEMPKEWMYYRVLKIEPIRFKFITITVEEVIVC